MNDSLSSLQLDLASPTPIILDGIKRIAPPRRILVSDSAQQFVRVASPSGSTEWDSAITPYMVEPMNLLSSRRYDSVVFVGPSRCGKTEALIDCWLAYAVLCDPGDMIGYFPTEISALDYSRRRLRRMHENSPEIREMLSPRAHENNNLLTVYRHGMILSLGWPTSSQMSQRDARYVALSDYDSFPDNIEGEGTAFDLGKKRVQAMMSAGMALVESSPKHVITVRDWRPEDPHDAPPVTGGILPIYQRGDRRRWYWQCKHCGTWFEAPALPNFEDHPDIEKAAASAHVACKCGGIHLPKDKKALQQNARWVPAGCSLDINGNLIGEPNGSPIASFWLLGCAAAFQNWASLVRNYKNALKGFEKNGMENDLRTTFNVDQGLPYLPKALINDRDSNKIRNRVEDWPKREVPEGVCYLTAAVDVQGSRFVVQVVGWGKDGEKWLVDRYNLKNSYRKNDADDYEPINPAKYIEDWQVIINRVALNPYPLAWKPDMGLKPLVVAVDSGGKAGVTERAYHFWKQCRAKGLGNKIILVKGSSKTDVPRITKSYPDSSRRSDRKANARGEVPVYLLNTLVLKDGIAADLERSEPGPGYVHLPAWVGAWFFDELTAEVRTATGWKNTGGARNEAFDLFVYNTAAHLFVQGDKIDWQHPPVYADPERNSTQCFTTLESATPVPLPPKPKRPKYGWGL